MEKVVEFFVQWIRGLNVRCRYILSYYMMTTSWRQLQYCLFINNAFHT